MSEGKRERPAARHPEDDQRSGTSWGAANERQSQKAGPPNDLTTELDPRAEESLRQLLHGVADRVEPDPTSLEQIQHAIPIRRARRRNTFIGAGAAALAVGVTLPLMQAGVVPGPLNDRAGNAAHSAHADSEEANGADALAGGQGGDSVPGPERHHNGAGGGEQETPSNSPAGSGSPSAGDEELSSTAPSCSNTQLGNPDVAVGDPDSQGRVYGSFQLSNISDEACRVRDGDGMTATGKGRADGVAFQVLEHTSGGRASELPDPSETRGPVILRPGESYEVQFAYLPAPETGVRCVPKDDKEPTDPPPGEGGDDGGDGGEGGDGGGSEGADGGGDGGDEAPGGEGGDGGSGESGVTVLSSRGAGDTESEGAVLLNYTPAAGDPQLPTAYVKSSCPGTVYRTGPLSVS